VVSEREPVANETAAVKPRRPFEIQTRYFDLLLPVAGVKRPAGRGAFPPRTNTFGVICSPSSSQCGSPRLAGPRVDSLEPHREPDRHRSALRR
jgi:hypothetical protein